VTARVSRAQVVRYRVRVSHLDQKLPAGSFARAAWGGLQDSAPRAGVISLHARVEDTKPDSWEDPSLVQIWFRGGADYIVPRDEVGVFTLGSFPRDPAQARELDRFVDDIHRVTEGRMLEVREVHSLLSLTHPTLLRTSAVTGRVHIRWDASNIWLIPVERPDIDVEDARRELGRRFLHWFGPATMLRMASWTGVQPRDAAATWNELEKELVGVNVDGDERSMLAADVDELVGAEPVMGVRLTPWDDPLTKLDKELLVDHDTMRAKVFPPNGQSLGYIPGAVLVDGAVVGAWQRQQRRVTIHPFSRLPADAREAIEREALAFPIAAKSRASVSWA
jgi:hypothetical protein